MADYTAENGFYWRPLGGNNIDQISGHCYQYTDVIKSKKKYPGRQSLLIWENLTIIRPWA